MVVGAGVGPNGILDGAAGRLEIDRGRRGKGAHVPRTRRAFPFLLGLLSALSGSLRNFFLYRINDGIGILSRGKHELQFIPEPLAGSGKIEVVTFDCKTIRKRDATPRRMPGIGPVAS